jgi:hypothetical protein
MADKPKLSLQASEAAVVQAAATIYAAYIINDRVHEGQEAKWMRRSIREAFEIAVATDEAIQSDTELG